MTCSNKNGSCHAEQDCMEAGECLVAMNVIPPNNGERADPNGHDHIEHAAQGGPSPGVAASDGAVPATPAAACLGKCDCRLEGSCMGENDAKGGVKVFLWPGLHLQKTYGRRTLLEFIMDIRLCASCFRRISAKDVLLDRQWADMSKMAERKHYGVLPIRHLTTIEHVKPEDPEYAALRGSYQHPGAAAPQQGAGDVKS